MAAFPYLGSNICANGDPGPEIDARVGRATGAFKMLHKRLWGRKQISVRVKLRFYGASIISVLLYGLETLPIRKVDLDKLEVLHRRNIRAIMGFKLTDRIPNQQLLEQSGLRSIEFLLKRQRLRVVGHTARQNVERPARLAVFSDVPTSWTNKAGGCRKTWKRTVEDDLSDFMDGYSKFRYATGFAWKRIICDVAQDRHQWSLISRNMLNENGNPP